MRRLAASAASSRLSSEAFAMRLGASTDCGSSMVSSLSASSYPTGSGAVGDVLIGSDGSGVTCITFEQHSAIVRYPNSMSNLRRLRCYLLACQVCVYGAFLDARIRNLYIVLMFEMRVST